MENRYLLENTLYQNPSQYDTIINDKGLSAEIFIANFVGFVVLYGVDHTNAQLQTYLRADGPTRLNHMRDDNNDMSLAVKIAADANVIRTTKAREITRFMYLIKTRKITTIDEDALRGLIAGDSLLLNALSGQWKTEFQSYRDGKISVFQLIWNLRRRIIRRDDLGSEFTDLVRRMLPAIKKRVGSTSANDPDDAPAQPAATPDPDPAVASAVVAIDPVDNGNTTTAPTSHPDPASSTDVSIQQAATATPAGQNPYDLTDVGNANRQFVKAMEDPDPSGYLRGIGSSITKFPYDMLYVNIDDDYGVAVAYYQNKDKIKTLGNRLGEINGIQPPKRNIQYVIELFGFLKTDATSMSLADLYADLLDRYPAVEKNFSRPSPYRSFRRTSDVPMYGSAAGFAVAMIMGQHGDKSVAEREVLIAKLVRLSYELNDIDLLHTLKGTSTYVKVPTAEFDRSIMDQIDAEDRPFYAGFIALAVLGSMNWNATGAWSDVSAKGYTGLLDDRRYSNDNLQSDAELLQFFNDNDYFDHPAVQHMKLIDVGSTDGKDAYEMFAQDFVGNANAIQSAIVAPALDYLIDNDMHEDLVGRIADTIVAMGPANYGAAPRRFIQSLGSRIAADYDSSVGKHDPQDAVAAIIPRMANSLLDELWIARKFYEAGGDRSDSLGRFLKIVTTLAENSVMTYSTGQSSVEIKEHHVFERYAEHIEVPSRFTTDSAMVEHVDNALQVFDTGGNNVSNESAIRMWPAFPYLVAHGAINFSPLAFVKYFNERWKPGSNVGDTPAERATAFIGPVGSRIRNSHSLGGLANDLSDVARFVGKRPPLLDNVLKAMHALMQQHGYITAQARRAGASLDKIASVMTLMKEAVPESASTADNIVMNIISDSANPFEAVLSLAVTDVEVDTIIDLVDNIADDVMGIGTVRIDTNKHVNYSSMQIARLYKQSPDKAEAVIAHMIKIGMLNDETVVYLFRGQDSLYETHFELLNVMIENGLQVDDQQVETMFEGALSTLFHSRKSTDMYSRQMGATGVFDLSKHVDPFPHVKDLIQPKLNEHMKDVLMKENGKVLRAVFNESYSELTDLLTSIPNPGEIVDGMSSPTYKRRMLDTIVTSKVLARSDIRGQLYDANQPVKPLMEMSDARITKILEFNDIHFKPDNARRKKRETFDSYITRVADGTNATLDLGNVMVEIETKTETELELMTVEYSAYETGRHGNFGLEFTQTMTAGSDLTKPEYHAFKEKYPSTTMYPMFHGTGSVAASMILRKGFAVIDPSDPSAVGRMLGNGIYATNALDKAGQYIGDNGFGRKKGTVGYMFETEAVLGEEGVHHKAAGVGNDRIRSPEWCFFNAGEQLSFKKAHKVVMVGGHRIKELRSKHNLNESAATPIRAFGDWVKAINEDSRKNLTESVDSEYPEATVFVFKNGRLPTVGGGSIHWKSFDSVYGSYDNVHMESNRHGVCMVVHHYGHDDLDSSVYIISNPDVWAKENGITHQAFIETVEQTE